MNKIKWFFRVMVALCLLATVIATIQRDWMAMVMFLLQAIIFAILAFERAQRRGESMRREGMRA
jgi:lysylphosphatidylglycerol synthetase-like protein (DUF2156 family)